MRKNSLRKKSKPILKREFGSSPLREDGRNLRSHRRNFRSHRRDLRSHKAPLQVKILAYYQANSNRTYLRPSQPLRCPIVAKSFLPKPTPRHARILKKLQVLLGGWPTSPARAQLLVLKCWPRKNLGCPRSRAVRNLGLHGHVNLGVLFDGVTESP